MFVYTIQPVVNSVVKPVSQPVVSCMQTFSRLSNRLYDPVSQPVERTVAVCVEHGCQTRLTTGCIVLTTVLNEQPLVLQPVVKPGCTTGLTTGCIHDTAVCQTGLTTGGMFVYTIQPVIKPVWQPVVSCIQTFTRLLNRFGNQFDNRLYRVNGALQVIRHRDDRWIPVSRDISRTVLWVYGLSSWLRTKSLAVSTFSWVRAQIDEKVSK